MATLYGKAVRDAAVEKPASRYPLVIISHGYPGNRFLMSHIGENLASKGFVTVSIDHKDSTYDDQKSFGSTLYNRPFDQLFVLNEIDRLSKPGSGSFLAGLVDATRAGIIGYSMGGYGVVNVIGGGYSAASAASRHAPPNKMLTERGAANPEYQKARDPRIKAAIAIGPWGMQGGFWDAEGLKGIRTPVMFVAGSADDVSGYEKGHARDLPGRGQCRSLSADVHQRQSQRRGADSRAAGNLCVFGGATSPSVHALRRRGVGHGAHEQHLQSLRDRVLRTASQGRDGQAGVSRSSCRTARTRCMPSIATASRRRPTHYWKGFKRATAVGLILEHAAPAR